MNKEGKESICSCSPSNTRPATSTNSESVSCSSNRIHVKRRRIHMSKSKVSLRWRAADAIAAAELCLPEYGDERLQRKSELKDLWHRHRDAILNLLESICNAEICTSPPNTDQFWRSITQQLVWDLNLTIEVNDETIESCKIYTLSLEKLHKEFQAKEKSLKKIQRKQVSLGPPELKKKLFSVFERKHISFKRVSSSGKTTRTSGRSSGKTTRTSGRSSGANRHSNSSINMPSIKLDLKEKVDAAIYKLACAKSFNSRDLNKVQSFIYSNELNCKVFLDYNDDDKVFMIKDFLNHNRGESSHL